MKVKHYVCTSLNNQNFALVADKEPASRFYQKITEVTKAECEKQAKATELISDIEGVVRRYVYNSARNEFDCIYSSAGTNIGANDWGFFK